MMTMFFRSDMIDATVDAMTGNGMRWSETKTRGAKGKDKLAAFIDYHQPEPDVYLFQSLLSLAPSPIAVANPLPDDRVMCLLDNFDNCGTLGNFVCQDLYVITVVLSVMINSSIFVRLELQQARTKNRHNKQLHLSFLTMPPMTLRDRVIKR